MQRMYRVTALPLFSDNYSYIVQGALEHRLVLVDPADTQCVLAYLRENLAAYKVSHVLYTHKHYDHAGDSERLISVLRQTNADLKVLAGKVDAPYIKGVDTPIDKNCDIGLGLSVLRTILTPCHTRGHAVYTFLPLQGQTQTVENTKDDKPGQSVRIAGRKVHQFVTAACAFTGDTLFGGGIGKFFEGDAKDMFAALHAILKTVPPETSIFCGHEYTLQNLRWSRQVEIGNADLLAHSQRLQEESVIVGDDLCTIPTSLQLQMRINVFLRAAIGAAFGEFKDPIELLHILRKMKDQGKSHHPTALL